MNRGHGGGIYNTGTLTLKNSTVSHNRAVPWHHPDCDDCSGRFCIPLFCNIGGYGAGIANEGGTVTLIDSAVDEI